MRHASQSPRARVTLSQRQKDLVVKIEDWGVGFDINRIDRVPSSYLGSWGATPEVVAFVQDLRQTDLYKRPGVAETLDWMNALVALNETRLTADNVRSTLGVLLKYQEDVDLAGGERVEEILER